MIMKATDAKAARFTTYQKLLKKKEKDIQDKYLKAVEDLESAIYEISHDDEGNVFQFNFNTFSPIRKWRAGEIDSVEVLRQMEKMNFEEAAKSKLLKDIKAYQETFDNVHNMLQAMIHGALNEIESGIVPSVVNYLDSAKRLFTEIVEEEKLQVKVLHGFVDMSKPEKDRMKWEEMTLDQTIKFIVTNKINKANESSVVNKVLINFEFFKEKTTEVEKSHWFLATPKSRDILATLFEVQYNVTIAQDKLKWLDDIVEAKHA